ncbi:MAG: nickel pincer cofactor biosynthesis protein LarC [Endomicrobium sp.]|nr:nickel pincer cofactor biosynthesis protein LarC [Endomicrobium sp.]
MNILYLQCQMGASGDMIMSSLFELIENKKNFLNKINNLGINGVKITAKEVIKFGIKGSHLEVLVHDKKELLHSKNQSHKSTNLGTIENIIEKLNISRTVKKNSLQIYKIIVNAEAHIHNKKVNQIHFHEVGNLDAIVDIVGSCLLIENISPDKIIASSINLGNGFTSCMHGILPVPAPATAFILKGIPTYSNAVDGELCTPTGAAILKFFATEFNTMPEMIINKIGYGIGSKDFKIFNCLRAFLGKTNAKSLTANESITKLECNLDDMTGEAISFATNTLLKNGALDVYTTAIQMKKNRPGILLTCLCNVDQSNFFADLILKHTSSLGVRISTCKRCSLDRKISKIATPYGNINIKVSKNRNIEKSKIEYDDIAKIAKLKNISFDKTLKILREHNDHSTKI